MARKMHLGIFMAMLCMMEVASAGRLIEIKLKSYKNPGNRLFDSQTCCESDQSICRSSCLNTIMLCVSSVVNKGSCDIINSMKVNKIEVEDDETFNEGERETRFTNPFKVALPDNFKQDKVSLSFKVFQSGKTLAAEFKDIEITMETATLSWQSIYIETEATVRRYKRFVKKMDFEARAMCSKDYTGKYCDVKICTPHDDTSGHYTCTKNHQRVCLPGWIDPSTNCLTRKVQPTSSIIIKPSTNILQPMVTTIYPTSSSQPIKSLKTSSLTNEIQETSHVFILMSSSINNQEIDSTTSQFQQFLKTSIHPTKSVSNELPTSTAVPTPLPTTIAPKVTTKLPTKSTTNPPKTIAPKTTPQSPTTKKKTASEPTVKSTQKKTTQNTFPTEKPTTKQVVTTENILTTQETIVTITKRNRTPTTEKPSTFEPTATEQLEPTTKPPRPSERSGSQEIDEEREKAKIDNTVLITVICLTLAIVAWVVVLIVVRKRVKSKNKIHQSQMMQKSGTYIVPQPITSIVSTTISSTIENTISISLQNQNFMETNLTEPLV